MGSTRLAMLQPSSAPSSSSSTAAVFMVGELSGCVADRIRAFGASSRLHTYALLDPKFSADAGLVDTMRRSGIYIGFQPDPPTSMLNFAGSSGTTKPAFIKWLIAQTQYEHAWHLEDDVFFSGSWDNLLLDPRLRPDAHLVASQKSGWTSDWANMMTETFGECLVGAGRPCFDHAANATQTSWPLLRMSRFYAQRLAAAFADGANGHHEILTGSFCLANSDWCDLQQLPSERLGVYVLGRWANETHNFNCAVQTARADRLALTDLASASSVPCSDPLALPPEDAPPEWRCKLFHPTKCRIQNESGSLQLAWAAVASEGCPSTPRIY